MIIQTKLQTKRREFVDLDEAVRSPKKLGNKGRFYGAICISISGAQVMTEAHWDCIDLLWGEIVHGLEAVTDHGHYVGSFPDQPVKLTLQKEGDDLTLIVGTKPPRSGRCDYGDFGRALLAEAQRAFEAFKTLSAQNKHSWYDSYLNRIDRLRGRFSDHACGREHT